MTALTNPSKNFLEVMTTDVNVGMNDVIAIFVSRYERDLTDLRTKLQAEVKQLKKEIVDHEKAIVASVDRDQYNHSVHALGVKFRVQDVAVVWNRDNYGDKIKNKIVVTIGLRDLNSKRDEEYNDWTKQIKTPMDVVDIEMHSSLETSLETANTKLLDVLQKLKNVSMKERELRGRMAEMKMTQAGYGELVNDEAMMSLIAIK